MIFVGEKDLNLRQCSEVREGLGGREGDASEEEGNVQEHYLNGRYRRCLNNAMAHLKCLWATQDFYEYRKSEFP